MPPKGKRKAATQATSAAKTKQVRKDDQKNVSKEVNVPIDAGFFGTASKGTGFDAEFSCMH
jgi:hypothetical protein